MKPCKRVLMICNSTNKMDLNIVQDDEFIDPQPLVTKIQNAQTLGDFKPSSLVLFDAKNGLQEQVIAINNQMYIIGVKYSLKCNLMMARTFKEEFLRWDTNLQWFLASSYHNLRMNMVHHFRPKATKVIHYKLIKCSIEPF